MVAYRHHSPLITELQGRVVKRIWASDYHHRTSAIIVMTPGGLVAVVVITAVSRSWRERKHRLLVSSLLDFKRRKKAKLSMGLGLGQVGFGIGSV